MKKSAALILFLVLFSSSFFSAVEFQGKSDFQQGETFLARISGNFFEPISEIDIVFLKGHTRISIVPIVEKIDNDFYVYAQLLGKQPGNYSLVVENAKVLEFGQIVEQDLEKNFTINKNFSDFSVKPGFISTNESFSIEVQNLRNFEITLNYEIVNESEISESESETKGFFDFGSLFGNSETSEESGENEISIKTGETKKINFDKNDFDSFVIQKILFSTENTNYEFPVFISSEKNENISGGGKLRFEPSEFDISLGLNSKINSTVYLFNLDNEDLENIELSFSDELKPYILLPTKNISQLDKNLSEKLEINFFSGNKEEKVEGQIRAKTQDDFYAYISVSLNFIKNYQPTNASDSSTPSCQEFNGTICTSTQKCENENAKVSRNGICCLSVCAEVTTSSYGKIIGWTIVVLILSFLVWFYFFKYRKTKNVVDLLKVARGR